MKKELMEDFEKNSVSSCYDLKRYFSRLHPDIRWCQCLYFLTWNSFEKRVLSILKLIKNHFTILLVKCQPLLL